jgi:hypothetical protein
VYLSNTGSTATTHIHTAAATRGTGTAASGQHGGWGRGLGPLQATHVRGWLALGWPGAPTLQTDYTRHPWQNQALHGYIYSLFDGNVARPASCFVVQTASFSMAHYCHTADPPRCHPAMQTQTHDPKHLNDCNRKTLTCTYLPTYYCMHPLSKASVTANTTKTPPHPHTDVASVLPHGTGQPPHGGGHHSCTTKLILLQAHALALLTPQHWFDYRH